MGYFLSLFFLLLSSFAYNQSLLTDFTRLESQGEIPAVFTQLATEKFKKDFKQNADKKLDKDFFLSTNFIIDGLLNSGKILFNDPLSDYVNKVAKVVLESEKDLYNELQFYVMKSSAVNAFSTNQGIIFFTTGLLSQLENEAQLAFVIAHEVTHYTEKHVQKSYVVKQNEPSISGTYTQHSYDERIANLSKYAKENEFQADLKGVLLYLKTEYETSELLTSFDVLNYSHIPFEDDKFDLTFFNAPQLTVPLSYFTNEVAPISNNENDSDENKSHPNILKRKQKVTKVLKSTNELGSKKFIVSEASFYLVRDLARFESININLSHLEYGKALYAIFILQKKYPDNYFLALSKCKALYGLVKFKNHSKYKLVTESLDDIEGQSFVLHHFIKHVKKEHLNVIAYRTIHDLSAAYPNVLLLKTYLTDIKRELAIFSDIEPSAFLEIKSDSMFADTTFHLYGLYDLVKEENLKEELYSISLKYFKDKKKEPVDFITVINRNLDIDKVIVVNPIYENYNLSKGKQFIKSERKEQEMLAIFEESHKKLDLETVLLDYKKLDSTAIKEYNEMGLIYDWLSEVLLAAELETDMINSNFADLTPIIEKYGTTHFLFTGVYGYSLKHDFTGADAGLALSVFPIPIIIVNKMVRHHYFEFIAFAINAETNRIEYIESKNVNFKSFNLLIEQHWYNVLYELSKKQ